MDKSLELLRKTVACKAVTSDIAAVNRVSDLMREYLEENGINVVVEEAGGRRLLYASRTPGKVCDVLINAHMDVVPLSLPEQGEMKEDGNVVLGRGVHDCQGNAIAVANAIIQYTGKTKLGAILSCDEETGGHTLPIVLDRGYRPLKMSIVVDGGAYSIICAEKGLLSINIKAKGKSGHSSTPWECDNALDHLIDAYVRLRNAWPKVTPPDTWRDTMAATMISAAPAHNQIPGSATLCLNFRYVGDDGRQRIMSMVEKYMGGMEYEFVDHRDYMMADPDNGCLKLLQKSIEEATNHEVVMSKMHGATDAVYFKKYGVPVGVIGTVGGGAHMASEWLDWTSVAEYTKAIVLLAKKLEDQPCQA
ncbi:MAG: M20/M25/M40 family metallo-hydrolase [Victivallales bacterium]|nr:M20/M25/M40 family metallo-hydrolase [Victivallales bacterium]